MEIIPKEAFDLAEKIYGDIAGPGLQVVGKAVADAIKLITLPFSFLGITSEALLEKYKEFICRSLKKVPREKLVQPEPIIASKVFDNVKYVFDDEELYEMFANLLSSSMNIETKQKVHVSFVSIIEQMDAIDAKLFYEIHRKQVFPIANILFGVENVRVQNVFSRLCVFEDIDPMKLSVAIVNLVRLGVVEINSNIHLPDELFIDIRNCDIYKRISAIYARVKKEDEKFSDCNIIIDKSSCTFTTLGEIFSQFVFGGK